MKKISILVFSFLLCFNINLYSKGNLIFVFRYDDFILQSDNINKEIVKLFLKNNIPLVLGVVPCNENEKLILEKNYLFLDTLKQAKKDKTIEIALHGFNHKNLGNGEFCNVNYQEQYRRMKLGKYYLDSIFNQKTITFIPPWNAYDKQTLNVMEKLGMKIISSSLTMNQPFFNASISYFPHTLEHPSELFTLMKNLSNKKGIIVVMFHHYDFNKEFNLTDLDNILIQLKNYPFVHFSTFDGLLQQNEKSDAKRIQANLNANLLYKILNVEGILLRTQDAIIIRILNLLLYVLICDFFFIISCFVGLKKFKLSFKKILLPTLILTILVSFSVWYHLLGPLKLMSILCFFSVLMGSFLPIIFNHNKQKP